jgi:hypothetical protein
VTPPPAGILEREPRTRRVPTHATPGTEEKGGERETTLLQGPGKLKPRVPNRRFL